MRFLRASLALDLKQRDRKIGRQWGENSLKCVITSNPRVGLYFNQKPIFCKYFDGFCFTGAETFGMGYNRTEWEIKEKPMTTTSKIVFVVGLVCSSLLILFSGQANIKHYEHVQRSIEDIYEDRLVVKGLIFELSSLLHQKEIANISGNESFYVKTNPSINSQIEANLQAFRATQLTPAEATTLEQFSAEFETLSSSENALGLSDGHDFTPAEVAPLSTQIHELQDHLKVLADIQLSEGKRKLMASEESSSSMRLFARVENYMLIIFAVLAIGIVFFVPGNRD